VIDFISIIPFDFINHLVQNSDISKLKAVKVIRLLRLLKLARMARAFRVFHHIELRMSITYGKLALLKFFGILFIISHWLACFWALTLVLVEEDDHTPRWIDAFTLKEKDMIDKTKDTPWKLYITCLYFTSYTITSVGYGDIGPANIVETICCTIMIVISGISWAIVLGQVCGTIAGLNQEEQDFRSLMDELNSMMQDRVMPGLMRYRVRSYFLSSKLAQRRNRHKRIVHQLSPGLQGEVVMMVNRRWMSKVSLLNQVMILAQAGTKNAAKCTSFIVDVSLKLTSSAYAQMETFGVDHTLYILIRGLCSGRGRILRTGSVWGTDFILSDTRLTENSETNALTYIEVTALSREDFVNLVDKHCEKNLELRRIVRRYVGWLALQRYIMKEAKQARAAAPASESLANGSVVTKFSEGGSFLGPEA